MIRIPGSSVIPQKAYINKEQTDHCIMVEVFRTNVTDGSCAAQLSEMLRSLFPGCKVTFDLDDCDRILRIEGQAASETVIFLLKNSGYLCEVLEN